MEHSYSCTYPEGCSCGAAKFNRTLAALEKSIKKQHETLDLLDTADALITNSDSCVNLPSEIHKWKMKYYEFLNE